MHGICVSICLGASGDTVKSGISKDLVSITRNQAEERAEVDSISCLLYGRIGIL